MEEKQNRDTLPSDSNLFFVAKRDYTMASIVHRMAAKTKFTDENNPVIEVSEEHLHPSQSIVFKYKIDGIKKYLEETNGILNYYPIGVKVGEEVYIIDGHHRSAAQIALYKKAKVRVVEIPEEDVQKEIEKNKKRAEEITQNQKHPTRFIAKQHDIEETRKKIASYKGGLREYIQTKLKEERD